MRIEKSKFQAAVKCLMNDVTGFEEQLDCMYNNLNVLANLNRYRSRCDGNGTIPVANLQVKASGASSVSYDTTRLKAYDVFAVRISTDGGATMVVYGDGKYRVLHLKKGNANGAMPFAKLPWVKAAFGGEE